MRSALSRQYERLVDRSRIDPGIPSRVQRYYNNLTGFEYATAIRDLLGAAERVLLIGDGGGRDYYWLTYHGVDVYALDIAPQPIIPRLVLGDVTRGLPFPDSTFDGVVMAEVVEHLFEDWEALREVRRVLRPDGVLVLSTPFGNDLPEYHVRVHTPRTLERLLKYGGFSVDRIIYKGGGWALLDNGGILTLAKHAAALCAFWLTGKSIYPALMRRLAQSDIRAGRAPALRHRVSPLFGGIVAARPTQEEFDVRAINRYEFEDHLLPGRERA